MTYESIVKSLAFCLYCIFPFSCSPLIPPVRSSHHTVVHVHEPLFFCAQSLPPLHCVVILLSNYEPVPISPAKSLVFDDSIPILAISNL